MTTEPFFSSEPFLTLAAAFATLCWGVLKSSEFYKRLQRERFDRALNALEAGVEETYRTYVHALKAARVDCKLSPEECRHARHLARERAQAIAASTGADILRDIGEPFLDLWMAKLVKRLKRP